MNSYSVEDSSIISIVENISKFDSPSFANSGSGSLGPCEVGSPGGHSYKDFYLMAQYVTGLFIYPILCILGITGNVLALIVLGHRDMLTSTNVYLSALAVADTIKLVNDAMYFLLLLVLQSSPQTGQVMISSVYPYAHYIFNMSVCVTAWLTISVAAERYICVCHPSKAKELCTIPRARLICCSVFVSMMVLSIPSGLRYRLETVHDSLNNVTCPKVVPTSLGLNEEFMLPYTWIQNSLRGIIPVFVLVFVNARIINELRKERVKGKKFSARNRITLMLIVIIFMFLVCVTPDAIMSTFFKKGYVEEDYLAKGVREITDSLLAVNSAFNFLLYCSMSQAFRVTFIKIFLPFKCGTRSPERIPLSRKNTKTDCEVVRGNGCYNDSSRETYL